MNIPLPVGWTAVQLKDGRWYFAHIESGITQWDRPVSPEFAPPPPPLPQPQTTLPYTQFYLRESSSSQVTSNPDFLGSNLRPPESRNLAFQEVRNLTSRSTIGIHEAHLPSSSTAYTQPLKFSASERTNFAASGENDIAQQPANPDSHYNGSATDNLPCPEIQYPLFHLLNFPYAHNQFNFRPTAPPLPETVEEESQKFASQNFHDKPNETYSFSETSGGQFQGRFLAAEKVPRASGLIYSNSTIHNPGNIPLVSDESPSQVHMHTSPLTYSSQMEAIETSQGPKTIGAAIAGQSLIFLIKK